MSDTSSLSSVTIGRLPLVLTVREVADILQVSRPKVYLLIKEGYLSAFKLGNDWRVTRSALQDLITPRSYPSATQESHTACARQF